MYRNYKEIRKYNKNIREKSERKGKNTKKKKKTWRKTGRDETLDKERNQGNKAWFHEDVRKQYQKRIMPEKECYKEKQERIMEGFKN
jgi:hypothetical protein